MSVIPVRARCDTPAITVSHLLTYAFVLGATLAGLISSRELFQGLGAATWMLALVVAFCGVSVLMFLLSSLTERGVVPALFVVRKPQQDRVGTAFDVLLGRGLRLDLDEPVLVSQVAARSRQRNALPRQLVLQTSSAAFVTLPVRHDCPAALERKLAELRDVATQRHPAE